MSLFKPFIELSLRQQYILAVILLFELIGTVSLFYVLKRNERAVLAQEFIASSKELTSTIEKEISFDLEALNSIKALYSVSDSVSREQFKIFNSTILNRSKSIQALSWIPKVPFKEKTLFEIKAHEDGLSQFLIKENIDGKMMPVADREVYYPVYYIEPYKGNESALGFDLASNPTRLYALEKAIETNQFTATARITLVQEKETQKGILIFCPLKREGELIRLFTGVYRIKDLIDQSNDNLTTKNWNLTIYDISATEGNQLLVQLHENDNNLLPDDAIFKSPKGINYQQTINVADREWLIVSTPTKIYLNSISRTAELSLIISIILSIGFFYYFYRNFNEYNQQIKNQLILETTVNERTEELQEYAHVVSHDLKSPLRTIDALVNWLKEDNKEKLDNNSIANFELIETTLERMELLISDILSYSSVSSRTDKTGVVDLNMLVNSLIEVIILPAHISIDVLSKLPVIEGDPIKLQQLFQNLISNAIKFMDKEKGVIEIDVMEQKSFYQFSIKDNGIGIEDKYHKSIFNIFQSLDTTKDSTGIGLAIVKKIVTQFHGEIWVESEIGKGSTFYFTLKKGKNAIS